MATACREERQTSCLTSAIYRTADGSCNTANSPERGAHRATLKRIIHRVYDDAAEKMMKVRQMCLTLLVLIVWLVTGALVKDSSLPVFPHQQHHTLDLDLSLYSGIPNTSNGTCGWTTTILGDFDLCGDGYCRCKNETADCSRRNLTYFPRFPREITQVIFAYNSLRNISNDNFFVNITNVELIDLTGNGLKSMSPRAFLPMRNLEALILGSNHLNYTTLAPALSVTTLKILDLSSNRLDSPPGGTFDKYHLPHLEKLCLNGNNMKSLNMAVFQSLPSLEFLHLGGNYLSSELLRSASLPQLTGLSLDYNALTRFLDTCGGDNKVSLFPNLIFLNISSNRIFLSPYQRMCLPNLQMLSLQDLSIGAVVKDSFSQKIFPSLHFINLSRLQVFGELTMRMYAFRNPNLKVIFMESSGIDFAARSVNSGCFAGCPELQYLKLDGNDFSRVSEEKFTSLLGHVSRLLILSIRSASIKQISAGMFANLTDLKFLSLGSNELTNIPDGTFDSLVSLTRLDLSRNSISVVKESTFDMTIRSRLRALDLSDNPFKCSCDLIWFLTWFHIMPPLFQNQTPFQSYMCANIPNTMLQSFYIPDQACLLSHYVHSVIIVTVVFLTLLLLVGAAVYRYRWSVKAAMYRPSLPPEAYRWRTEPGWFCRLVFFLLLRHRWYIRLMLYGAFWRQENRLNRLQEREFRYDVFVAYDSEDLDWVRTHLVPMLETGLGLRLCIHQRDFTPGVPVVVNIMENVQASKTMMMVFSKNFAESEWCQFELQLCLSHVMEYDDTLLVVLLHDIPSRDITPAMEALMKTTTYIEWEAGAESKDAFWGRIRRALNDILPDV